MSRMGEKSDWNSNLLSKDLMHHAGRNGEHSCVENLHGDDLYPHNINKHSCTLQSLPEHQASKMYVYPTKKHIKSIQDMDILHAFSNYVRETFNHGPNLSAVDWGGKLKLHHTSCGPTLMEVDWGVKFNLNYTLCGFMLKEVDWGNKLLINSIADWQTHVTHQTGHNISEVDWGAFMTQVSSFSW